MNTGAHYLSLLLMATFLVIIIAVLIYVSHWLSAVSVENLIGMMPQ